MKRPMKNELFGQPSVRRLLPDDHFFYLIRDVETQVARRAYELFCGRGFAHGHDLEDWLQAESEFLTTACLNASESEDALTLKAQVPGYHANEIEIYVEPQRIFISGQEPRGTEKEKSQKQAAYSHKAQRSRWMLCRLDLPAEIEPEKVQARLDGGELCVELPKHKPAEKIMLVSRATA
jgi:HSP20 family protein